LQSQARARATEYAREISNVRGSEADPDWMEARIRELVSGSDRIREVRTIKGQKLESLGMNLFY